MPTTIYRIQDAEGRGPYRPGMSLRWTDPDAAPSARPPFFFEFRDLKVDRLEPGHSGCGFRTMDQLCRWFTPRERATLAAMGYFVVQIEADEILAESATQLVFTSRLPLSQGGILLPIPQEIVA